MGAASSCPTPLVSSLAAHTWANLREPSPDLVKALLINASERREHDPKLGWGTPYHGHLPWNCEEGSVTLAWRAQLQPGANYYWNDIPIPTELVRNGKLYGRASLTAVLRPLVSPFRGANYFASRLQTSLRSPTGSHWEPLVGSMLESTLKEQDAREELRKWQPVRRHVKDFSTRGGIAFNGTHLQLSARVFTRDLYQFGWPHHSQASPQDVAFVLTLWSGEPEPASYNSMARLLGNFVESAVVNQEIEVWSRLTARNFVNRQQMRSCLRLSSCLSHTPVLSNRVSAQQKRDIEKSRPETVVTECLAGTEQIQKAARRDCLRPR